MAQQLAGRPGGVLAVLQELQELQAQPDSPLLAKGLVLLARMIARGKADVAQLAAEQGVAGLTGRLLLACSHQLQRPGPAADVALLALHLLELLVASVPPDTVAELALPASRQVAMALARLLEDPAGHGAPGTSAMQRALLLQCLGAANALLFRGLALQLEPGLLEPLLSSAALAEWLQSTLAASSGAAQAAQPAAHANDGVAEAAGGSRHQSIIWTPEPDPKAELIAALSLAHLWLIARTAGEAPGSGALEQVALRRHALESSALVASSSASSTVKALAFKCACTCILSLAAVGQQRSGSIRMHQGSASSRMDVCGSDQFTSSGRWQQQQPAAGAWQHKRGRATVAAAAAAERYEPASAMASDLELADVLLCAAQQAACDSHSVVVREAALSCLAAMLGCRYSSAPSAPQDAAAEQPLGDGDALLLHTLHAAAAASDWNAVLLEEALARVQAAYLAPDSPLQQLYSRRQQRGGPDACSSQPQLALLPGSAGSMEACSAGAAPAELADVSCEQAAAALPAAADLLFVAALLEGAAAPSQQAWVRAQLAASLDQEQLLAVLGRAAALQEDLALHAALRALLGKGLLDGHASRLLDLLRSTGQETPQDTEPPGGWQGLSLQRLLALQGAAAGPGAAAQHPQSARLPAAQVALAHRMMEPVGGLCVALLPAAVHHCLARGAGHASRLLVQVLDPFSRSARALGQLLRAD
jgi:hypothetical protein